ncbi:MAG: hypothetical protein C0613_01345 [Desulfobulbaceae bacterium]|nr:MAG: hypothetical protein C0613_01345 [Desulfobulbaceae bacterium]
MEILLFRPFDKLRAALAGKMGGTAVATVSPCIVVHLLRYTLHCWQNRALSNKMIRPLRQAKKFLES